MADEVAAEAPVIVTTTLNKPPPLEIDISQRSGSIPLTIPKLQVPTEKPPCVPPLSSRYTAETESGDKFVFCVPEGYHEVHHHDGNKDMKRFLEDDESHGRILEIDFLGEVEREQEEEETTTKKTKEQAKRYVGKAASKLCRKIFDAVIQDMHCERHEVVSCIDTEHDPNQPGTPRSGWVNNIRAIVYGHATIGNVPYDDTFGGIGSIVQAVTPREDRQSNAGDEIRKHVNVVLAEVNGALVFLTMVRTSFEPVVSTPRSVYRWLSNTWSWGRGLEQWEPSTDPLIQTDTEVLRSVVSSLRWCEKGEEPTPLSPSFLAPTPKPKLELSPQVKEASEPLAPFHV